MCWLHLFTGDDGGASINSGSCMFGSIDGSKGTGMDIAALSDKAGDYSGRTDRLQASRMHYCMHTAIRQRELIP